MEKGRGREGTGELEPSLLQTKELKKKKKEREAERKNLSLTLFL